MRAELRHWRAFVEAAEAEHFGAAAERLGVSQSAVSQLVGALEAALGLRLFDRSGRRLRVSAAGRELLPQARAAVLQADRAAISGAALGRRSRNALAVGYVGSSAFHPLFARLIEAIDAALPPITLRLDQCSATVQVRHLTEARIDIGIVRSPLPTLDRSLASLRLANESLILALPCADPRHRGGAARLADFAQDEFILYIEQPSGGLRSLAIDACRTAGFEPKVAQTVPQIATMLCLTGAGVGIALVPATMTRFNVPGVAYLKLDDPIPTELTLLYRRSDTAPSLRAALRLARRLVDKRSLSK